MEVVAHSVGDCSVAGIGDDYRGSIGSDQGEKLEARLKQAYDGIKKQNDALKQLAGERDEFVKKYNDIVIERNNIVSNYNDLAARFKELQSGSGK